MVFSIYSDWFCNVLFYISNILCAKHFSRRPRAFYLKAAPPLKHANYLFFFWVGLLVSEQVLGRYWMYAASRNLYFYQFVPMKSVLMFESCFLIWLNHGCKDLQIQGHLQFPILGSLNLKPKECQIYMRHFVGEIGEQKWSDSFWSWLKLTSHTMCHYNLHW